ncbi:hypothetical protein UNH65_28410 [Chitinophaga sp. 180180018-2]|nr:hypothetical protein [Chitinophaga sp. 212800010-3]
MGIAFHLYISGYLDFNFTFQKFSATFAFRFKNYPLIREF